MNAEVSFVSLAIPQTTDEISSVGWAMPNTNYELLIQHS